MGAPPCPRCARASLRSFHACDQLNSFFIEHCKAPARRATDHDLIRARQAERVIQHVHEIALSDDDADISTKMYEQTAPDDPAVSESLI